jgi:hypothetical protein
MVAKEPFEQLHCQESRGILRRRIHRSLKSWHQLGPRAFLCPLSKQVFLPHLSYPSNFAPPVLNWAHRMNDKRNAGRNEDIGFFEYLVME